MLILTIRTDKPEAELSLCSETAVLAEFKWEAHRQLAETIHFKMRDLLSANNVQLSDLSGIVVYQGPGSFTGLRIGLSVANALSDSLGIGIIGSTGKNWAKDGTERLMQDESDQIAMPEYGAPVHITQQKK